MKKIVFRVDSGHHIGIGHVMRCLTLAETLRKSNYQVHFITRNHLGFIQEIIEEKFSLSVLEGGVQRTLSVEEKKDYKNWLGVSVSEDVRQTNDVIAAIGGGDLLVVDHYSLDSSYEKKITIPKIMVIDDLMNRAHYCDLLLDQNITAQKDLYLKLLDKNESLILPGPEFALLREEFQHLRKKVDVNSFNRPVKKIIVFFGGADAEGNTLKLAQVLHQTILCNFSFTFVLNSKHIDFSALKEIEKYHSEIQVASFVENFGQLMMNHDLFIGAGGTTSWERASLGVASAIIAIAQNQVGNCNELHRAIDAYYLGDSESITKKEWLSFFNEIVPNEVLWHRCRSNSYRLVDGLGVARVVEAIKKIIN